MKHYFVLCNVNSGLEYEIKYNILIKFMKMNEKDKDYFVNNYIINVYQIDDTVKEVGPNMISSDKLEWYYEF